MTTAPLNGFLSAAEIAACCQPVVSERTIRRRAQAEKWKTLRRARRGVPQLLFSVADAAKSLAETFRLECSHGRESTQQTPPLMLANLNDAARAVIAQRKQDLDSWRSYLRDHAARPDAPSKDTLTREWIEARNARGPGTVSRSRLYDWDALERAEGIIGLADGRQLPHTSAKQKEIPSLLWATFLRIYLDERRRSVETCYRAAIGDPQFDDSQRREWAGHFPVDLFRRRIRDLPERVTVYYREGPKAYADKCESPIRRDRRSLLSNELWCSDHHQLDVFVIDLATGKHFRPWLTVWQDVRSNKIMSWTIEQSPPNQHRVMTTFSSGVMTWGLPNNLLIDNGKDYRAKRFAGGRRLVDETEVSPLLAELEVIPHFANPYNARAKPTERFFRTLEEQFGKLWPSYCGNRPEHRPSDLQAILKNGVSPTLDELRDALENYVNWFCSEFEQQADGMDGMTPDAVFDAHLHTIRSVSQDQLRLLLMPSDVVTVTRGFVRLTIAGVGRWYTDSCGLLAALPPKTRIRARYNPHDLKKIYLFLADTNESLCAAIEQSSVPWFDTQSLRDAKARQNRLRREMKQGIAAEIEMAQSPRDPLEAISQQQRGYAALANSRSMRATGTDNQRSLPPPDRPTSAPLSAKPLANAFRVIDEPNAGDATQNQDTDWMDDLGRFHEKQRLAEEKRFAEGFDDDDPNSWLDDIAPDKVIEPTEGNDIHDGDYC